MTPARVQHVALYTPEDNGMRALDLSPVGVLSAGTVIRESLPALPFCAKRSVTAGPKSGLGATLRSVLFNTAFYAGTFLFALAALPLTLLPSRKPVAGAFRFWAKGVRALMRGLAGIKVTVEGRDNLPRNGAYLLAAKHQSEADGIVLMSLVPDLAWVAMRQIAKYPLVGPLLRKLDMVLIDADGGDAARRALIEGCRAVTAQGRPVVIYPEGTLMPVGERGPYRPGLYHVARTLGLKVIPVATSMGLGWDRRSFVKRPAKVTVKFLAPMSAGDDKDAFMRNLSEALESESNALAGL